MICLLVCKFGLDCIDGDEDIKHALCSECEQNLLVFSALCLYLTLICLLLKVTERILRGLIYY